MTLYTAWEGAVPATPTGFLSTELLRHQTRCFSNKSIICYYKYPPISVDKQSCTASIIIKICRGEEIVIFLFFQTQTQMLLIAMKIATKSCRVAILLILQNAGKWIKMTDRNRSENAYGCFAGQSTARRREQSMPGSAAKNRAWLACLACAAWPGCRPGRPMYTRVRCFRGERWYMNTD